MPLQNAAAILPDVSPDRLEFSILFDGNVARLLDRKVDLVSKNGLKPLIRSAVLEEARLVYAASAKPPRVSRRS